MRQKHIVISEKNFYRIIIDYLTNSLEHRLLQMFYYCYYPILIDQSIIVSEIKTNHPKQL